jgi:hypothetical protein
MEVRLWTYSPEPNYYPSTLSIEQSKQGQGTATKELYYAVMSCMADFHGINPIKV